MMSIKALTWDQVNAWRLAQHGFTARFKRVDFLQAASRMGGVQAQVLSAAELGLWARVDGLAREDIQTALWQERSLVKTWAMRSTLHLLPARDLPLFVAALSLPGTYTWDSYFAYYGMSPAQQDIYLAAFPQILGSEPITREQLASAVAEHTGLPGVRELILSTGWGSPLKAAAFRGDLCFGPSQGQNVTFVNPKAWTGHHQDIEPMEALQQIVRNYLQTYGPATSDDFARWWAGGIGKTLSKKVFQAMRDSFEEVDVEGWRAFALRENIDAMQAVEVADSVHLLPLFDGYTYQLGRDLEALLPKAYKPLIFRPQGWISAVVLVNGYIKGVWEYKTRRSGTTLTVRLFVPATAAIRQGIEAEAERLGDFWDSKVVLQVENV